MKRDGNTVYSEFQNRLLTLQSYSTESKPDLQCAQPLASSSVSAADADAPFRRTAILYTRADRKNTRRQLEE